MMGQNARFRHDFAAYLPIFIEKRRFLPKSETRKVSYFLFFKTRKVYYMTKCLKRLFVLSFGNNKLAMIGNIGCAKRKNVVKYKIG